MPVALWRRPARVLPLALAALLVAVAGCDSEPGIPTETARPTLTSVQITPTRDSLATDAPTATIPLSVQADLGGEGRMEVRVLVRYEETDSLAASARAAFEPGRIRIDVPLTVPRGATGDYRVQIVTEGADGRAGDQAAAVVHFAAASLGPPVVTNVEIASPISRPASGSRSTPIVVTVTDPDGIANVAVVALVDPATSGVIGRLFDKGRTGGSTDAVAGDGRYTAGLQVFSDTETGTFTLDAIAVDRAGTVSAPVPFTFTIQ